MVRKHPFVEDAELLEEILKIDEKIRKRNRYLGTVLGDAARKRIKYEALRYRRLAKLDEA